MSPTNTVRVIHHNYPGHQGFSAFGVGVPAGFFSSYGRTCRAAVRNLAKKLQAELERHESTLEELRKALK